MNRKVLLAGLVISLPLVGLLLISLGRDPQRMDSPLVGRAAPPFALRPAGGGEALALESLRGKAVVLNFWATWCVPCYQEHPVLTAGASRYPDVAFVGIVYEDEEPRVERYLREQGGSYPSLMDDGGKTAIAYGVYGVPETFFIAPDGTIVDKHTGPLSEERLRGLVERARSGALVRQGSR
jgi:cytochrome c biogenesis protein CcmG/thiol:disulfide interchange protein DsbE